jgi:hypothetical protein
MRGRLVLMRDAWPRQMEVFRLVVRRALVLVAIIKAQYRVFERVPTVLMSDPTGRLKRQ